MELAGVGGPEGDLELIALAVEALRATGLERFQIDLGDAGIVRALLDDLEPARRTILTEAVSRKDDAEIAQVCASENAAYGAELRALSALHGGREALVEGVGRLRETPAAPAAKRLLALFDAAVAHGLGQYLSADLGEVRGFAYYTGTVLHGYAAGTGDAIVSGGRYDELIGRFGWDLPAAGFAVDLNRADEALRAAGVVSATRPRAVVVGPPDDRRVADLRARGVVAVGRPEGGGAGDAKASSVIDWARAWGFTHVLDTSGWVDVATGASIPSPLERADGRQDNEKQQGRRNQ